jgi:hypothetical protein
MTPGIELEEYRIVNTNDSENKKQYKMEQGKKWRQFLAAVLCKKIIFY